MDVGFSADYWFARHLLQRGIGAMYLVAFLVALNQFRPLLGEKGLLPVPQYIRAVGFRQAPSLFHFLPKDWAFATFAWAGVFLSFLAVTGISESFGTPFSMAVWTLLWVLYLSFVNVGQTFYAFGWESLLLESGFFAIFLGASHTGPSFITILLMRWILFRTMLGAGLIKVRGDPCWRDLTCLHYHFETQPMPNPLAWYFHHLPGALKKVGVAFNHFVELAVPFLYFAPQPLAGIGGLFTVIFQGMLIVSGNFSWLNWITLVLAFSTFSDGQLAWIPLHVPGLVSMAPVHQGAIWGVLIVTVALSIRPVRNLLCENQIMNTGYNPLHLVNTYGAFGSITKERYEIVLEGTEEQSPATTSWRAYEFKGKPGDPSRLPPQVAPYHLRLDWLMWFAAMPSPYIPRWLLRLVEKLLEGDIATLSLLKTNPFPDRPPRMVRALYYRYRFSTPAKRRESGRWWERELVEQYLPPVSLEKEES